MKRKNYEIAQSPKMTQKTIDWGKVIDKYAAEQNRLWAEKLLAQTSTPRYIAFLLKEKFLQISFRFGQESILIYYDNSSFRQELTDVLSDLINRE